MHFTTLLKIWTLHALDSFYMLFQSALADEISCSITKYISR